MAIYYAFFFYSLSLQNKAVTSQITKTSPEKKGQMNSDMLAKSMGVLSIWSCNKGSAPYSNKIRTTRACS